MQTRRIDYAILFSTNRGSENRRPPSQSSRRSASVALSTRVVLVRPAVAVGLLRADWGGHGSREPLSLRSSGGGGKRAPDCALRTGSPALCRAGLAVGCAPPSRAPR